MFEINDENGNKIDSVVITKRYPDTVLNFYHSVDEYIDEYSSVLRNIIERYENKLDFSDAMESRSDAEFELYKAVMGI